MSQLNKPKYTQLTPREHVLKRSDMYIGSIESQQKNLYIVKNNRIVNQEITISDGGMKIFDEILVNIRDQNIRDKTMNIVKINFDASGMFTAYNNGNNGIPVEEQSPGMYAPGFIFGELLTSSTYEEKGRLVGGKNGLGAKLTNIFSKKFIVEVVDNKKNYFKQIFSDNLSNKSIPEIKKNINSTPYVKLTFIPDYEKLNIKFDKNFEAAIKKRVYDICACMIGNVNVYYNDILINNYIKSFEDYICLYDIDNIKINKKKIYYEKFSDRWEVGIYIDNNRNNKKITSVSFVNGINTEFGGKHVDHVVKTITDLLIKKLKTLKKFSKFTIKPETIKKLFIIFINSQIEDPSFDGQTKSMLKSSVKSFGSVCVPSENFINKLAENTIIHDEIILASQIKDLKLVKKNDGSKLRKVRIDKLDDSKFAGTKNSHKCTLILVEGDSAKTFATSGISERKDKEYFGVFPLKGKVLNVKKASLEKTFDNKEISNLKKILGLKTGKLLTLKDLRYGRIIILTDEDKDGYHIKGLLINLFEEFLPSVLQTENKFIASLRTPIVKVWKKKDTKKKSLIEFFTEQDYKQWAETQKNLNLWDIKYFKGLATSDPKKDAPKCFKDLDNKIIYLQWEKERIKSEDIVTKKKTKLDVLKEYRDFESPSYRSIKLAFDDTKISDRKKWLDTYDNNSYIKVGENIVPYSDFFNKEFIHFSYYDNTRSIPSVIDGLKPSQRKILWAALKRKELKTKSMKVAQFGAYVAECSSYHHGEVSLYDTIIKMANNYVGTNNINLFKPEGGFGSRKALAAGAARYIYTKLEDITYYIFRKEDEIIYNYKNEDNNIIEPEYYIPIIPMILINGAIGIGTGYSTKVPKYDPLKIILSIKNMINGKPPIKLIPYFKGFKGQINEIDSVKNFRRYMCYGICKRDKSSKDILLITEIPIGDKHTKSIDSYKSYLDTLIDDNYKSGEENKSDKILIDYDHHNCGINKIDLKLFFIPGIIDKLIKNNTLYKTLKLSTIINTSSMYLFNSKNKIIHYKHTGEILTDFYKARILAYKKRKEYYVKILLNDMLIIEYKVKFINNYLNDIIILKKGKTPVKISEIINKLEELKFPKLSKDAFAIESDKTYDYLIEMKITSLTSERIIILEKLYEEKKKNYEDYLNKTEKDLWLNELLLLEEKYNKWILNSDNI